MEEGLAPCLRRGLVVFGEREVNVELTRNNTTGHICHPLAMIVNGDHPAAVPGLGSK